MGNLKTNKQNPRTTTLNQYKEKHYKEDLQEGRQKLSTDSQGEYKQFHPHDFTHSECPWYFI
jgi:hypothetical protein